MSYFAVFDGHGGSRASTFASKQLHRHLLSRIPREGMRQIEKDIRRVIIDSYKKTDEEFLREACRSRPHWRDGSTSASLLLINNTLYIANLGDSKVVLARDIDANVTGETTKSVNDSNPDGDIVSRPHYRLAARCLTRDHNPVDYEERQRIQASGANVQNGRVNGILEVSRSFGDYQFKKQGVTCIPDVGKCVLTRQDRFVIIACDGLWKSFPPEEAVQLTNRLLLKEIADKRRWRSANLNGSQEEKSMLLTTHQVDAVCHQLTSEAVLRMSGDNVTCILVVFPEAYCSSTVSTPSSVEGEVTNTQSDSDGPLRKIPRTSLQ